MDFSFADVPVWFCVSLKSDSDYCYGFVIEQNAMWLNQENEITFIDMQFMKILAFYVRMIQVMDLN